MSRKKGSDFPPALKCQKCGRSMENVAEFTNSVKQIRRLGFVCHRCKSYAIRLEPAAGEPTVLWAGSLADDPYDPLLEIVKRASQPPRPS